MSEATTNALQELARRTRVTLNTIVQGAYALLLSRYSGEEEVLFGAVVSGRPATLPGVEEMVGFFMNTLPMRIQVKPEETVGVWLKRLQQQQVEQLQYEYSSLVQVQGWSDVPRGQPLFESVYVFENFPEGQSLQDETTKLEICVERVVEQTNYPLMLMVVPESQLHLHISYYKQRFDAATIQRMLLHLQTILEAMATSALHHPADARSLRVADIPLIREDERRQVLVEWNATTAAYSSDVCIHRLFEEQVGQAPEAIAVVCGDEQITYRALNTRADALALRLQGMGVGPEVLVCLCMERSVELLVGLLGILKAGGAYVPLDPAYPAGAVGLYATRYTGQQAGGRATTLDLNATTITCQASSAGRGDSRGAC